MQAQQGFNKSVAWTGSDGAWEPYDSFAQRIEAIATVLRTSKLVLKSLLELGNGWIQRIANQPLAELQSKADNKRCNKSKGEQLKRARMPSASNSHMP